MAKNKVEPKGINVDKPEAKKEKATAIEMVKEFLRQTNIELYTTPINLKIKEVSDGSIIIEKPAILARYKDANR